MRFVGGTGASDVRTDIEKRLRTSRVVCRLTPPHPRPLPIPASTRGRGSESIVLLASFLTQDHPHPASPMGTWERGRTKPSAFPLYFLRSFAPSSLPCFRRESNPRDAFERFGKDR